jgi:hypothetical protein
MRPHGSSQSNREGVETIVIYHVFLSFNFLCIEITKKKNMVLMETVHLCNCLIKLTSFANLIVSTCISTNDFPLLITINYSLSALIENKIFSVHGGLSPAISTLDQVRISTLIYLCLNF